MPHCPTVEGSKARKHIYHRAEFTASKSYMKHQFIRGGRALLTSAPLIRPHLLTLLEWELSFKPQQMLGTSPPSYIHVDNCALRDSVLRET